MKTYYAIISMGIILALLFINGTANITEKAIYYAGEEITIGGYTNYNTENSVQVEVWPATFGPKSKYALGMNGGGSVVVPVISVNNTRNRWSANFSSEGWSPDSYMVRAEVIGKNYSETAVFNLAEPLPDSNSGINNQTIQK